MHKAGYIIYVVIFIVILLVPLAGFAVPRHESTAELAEQDDLAPLPSFVQEDGTVNVSYLSELGDWFEDHFAFRDELITANSAWRSVTVGSTPEDEVIIGSDGWLFYRGTADDYLGRELFTNRELFDAAHNLSLMQNYVEDADCRFLFVICANKNSLYKSYMPYSYLPGETTNAADLGPFLQNAGIRFVDLHDALSGQSDLYFRRDTHWNGKGALIGYNEIMNALGLEHETYQGTRWIWRRDHRGDLDEILMPAAGIMETEYYLDTQTTFSYKDIPQSMRDPIIETTNSSGSGRLYMFRDSFGDSLIPLLSQHFSEATYSMYTPWNLPQATEVPGTDVVVEIVERNLTDLLNRPAIMPAPSAELVRIVAGQHSAEAVRAVKDGPYVRISGRVDAELLGTADDIVVRVLEGSEMRSYVPFYTSNEERLGNSFYLYLPDEGISGTVHVEVCTGNLKGDMRAVYSEEIAVESGGQNS